MTKETFIQALKEELPPKDYTVQLQSLWYDAKGEWNKAHDLIDQLDDNVSAHIHAYLHRAEGDLWNARYWYNRANQPEYKGTLEEERMYLVKKYS